MTSDSPYKAEQGKPTYKVLSLKRPWYRRHLQTEWIAKVEMEGRVYTLKLHGFLSWEHDSHSPKALEDEIRQSMQGVIKMRKAIDEFKALTNKTHTL